MKRCVVLDSAAEEVCNQNSIPPLIFQIPPEEGRQKLEDDQSTPVYKFPANICVRQIDTGEWGTIPVYFVEPQTAKPIRNVIFYIHGAGWVFGSFHTHENHDFVMLNALDQTEACRIAMDASTQWINRKNDVLHLTNLHHVLHPPATCQNRFDTTYPE
ncbi:MAG: hypothetical protein K2J67_01645 [Lachnospiraceae bacterium]|nr:hypothetical protein [Lachnospiraceae bacterium]